MPNRLVLSLLVVFATDSAALPSLAQTQRPQKPVRHTQPSPPSTCEYDPGDHLLSRFWQRITKDLTLHSPTETERLSELRLRVEDLANKKNALIEAIKGAVAESSLQGWQQTRGKAIPAMQQEISDLTLKIDEEVSKGGLLAGDPQLSELRRALFRKTEIFACELASIPFPLKPDDGTKLSRVVQLLANEEQALRGFDARLAQLIQKTKEQKQGGK